jgi:hypothetical protein
MRGFTLIETVIYIALLGMLMTGAVVTTYELMLSAGSSNSKNTTGEEGNFVLRKLDWALTGTSTLARITTPVPGAYGDTLTATRADGTSISVRRNVASSSVEISMDGGTTYTPLTTENVSVTNLGFYHIPVAGGTPEGIEASTTIDSLVFSIGRYVRK